MIARVWFGRTKFEDYDAYLAYLEESGVAALKQTPGNRGGTPSDVNTIRQFVRCRRKGGFEWGS